MGSVKARARLADQRGNQIGGQALCPLLQLGRQAGQSHAAQVLHGQVQDAVLLADVVDLDDVVMADLGSDSRFI